MRVFEPKEIASGSKYFDRAANSLTVNRAWDQKEHTPFAGLNIVEVGVNMGLSCAQPLTLTYG